MPAATLCITASRQGDYLVTSSALIASHVFLASPKSMSVLLLKKTGLSTPAYPEAMDLFMKIVCFARHT